MATGPSTVGCIATSRMGPTRPPIVLWFALSASWWWTWWMARSRTHSTRLARNADSVRETSEGSLDFIDRWKADRWMVL